MNAKSCVTCDSAASMFPMAVSAPEPRVEHASENSRVTDLMVSTRSPALPVSFAMPSLSVRPSPPTVSIGSVVTPLTAAKESSPIPSAMLMNIWLSVQAVWALMPTASRSKRTSLATKSPFCESLEWSFKG